MPVTVVLDIEWGVLSMVRRLYSCPSTRRVWCGFTKKTENSMSDLEFPDDELSSDDETLLYSVVYCSRAADGLGDADVDRILESARRRNPMLGITGVLVFGGGLFFQMLEGPRENVRQLMDLLHGDARHHGIIELSETEEMRERLFPDWDMELTTPDDIREVLINARDDAAAGAPAQALEDLLAQLDAGEFNRPERRPR